MQSAQRRAAAGPTGVLGAGLSSRPGTRWLRAMVGGGRRRRQQLLSAETHRQAVPRMRVLFPPPAGAVILVVPPVPHGGPHASTAHRAVAATLAVAVRALHGQLHATVLLMIQVGAGERVRRRGLDGRGRHVVHGLQCRSSFDTSLSARARGYPQGRRRDSEPGLGAQALTS